MAQFLASLIHPADREDLLHIDFDRDGSNNTVVELNALQLPPAGSVPTGLPSPDSSVLLALFGDEERDDSFAPTSLRSSLRDAGSEPSPELNQVHSGRAFPAPAALEALRGVESVSNQDPIEVDRPDGGGPANMFADGFQRIGLDDRDIAGLSVPAIAGTLNAAGLEHGRGDHRDALAAAWADDGPPHVLTDAPGDVWTYSQMADYLLNGFWQWAGGAAHHFATSTITYNIDALTAAGQNLANLALQAWHDICNLNFVQTSTDALITFDDNQSGAFASYTASGSTTTSAFVNVSTAWLATYGTGMDTYSYQTYIHEIGHALGLGHAGPYNGTATYGVDNNHANDTWQYSIMSYFSQPNFGGASYRFTMTPMIADIVALDSVYGAATSTRTGDTVYGFNTNAGTLYNFSTYASPPALTLYDSAGTDILDCSGYGVAQLIDLRPGNYSNIGGLIGNIGIATNVTIENAIGGAGGDAIVGNVTANVLASGAGDDTLNGVGGADFLSGGTGVDKFVLDSTAYIDATAGAPIVDMISDYDQGNGLFNFAEGDKVDLSSLLGLVSDQPLNTIARLVADPSNALVGLQIDVNGAASGANWVTMAYLDALHPGNFVQAITNSSQPNGVTLSVQGAYGLTGDFNGDGKSDFLWRHDNGLVALWEMNGSDLLSAPIVGQVGNEWHIVGTGDFNGDSRDDLLWRNDSGVVAIWEMNGSQLLSAPIIGQVGNDWQIAGVGDFNGDSKDDFLWRNDSGVVAIWEMNGSQLLSATTIGLVGNDWHIVGSGDFNGDSKSDILWRHDNGSVAIWEMNGGQLLSAPIIGQVGNDWHIVGTGDFNGDSKSDFLWRHDNGSVAIWEMNGSQLLSAPIIGQIGNEWHVDGTGDFNDDGKSDIIWRNDNGAIAIWEMNGSQLIAGPVIGNVGNEWMINTHNYDFV